MAHEITIKITPDGDIFFLYNDHSPLREMGRMELKRASNVLWDDEEQKWMVVFNDPSGETFVLPEKHTDRIEAIKYEIKYLNERMQSVAVEALFQKEETNLQKIFGKNTHLLDK